jgi:hypothetical protein
MVFPFGTGEEFADVVVAEAAAKAERAAFGAVRHGSRRSQNLVKANPKGGINDFLKRLVQPCRALSGFGGYIRVERQGGSHAGIMMPLQ